MPDFTKKEKELRAAGVRYLFGAYVDIHGVPKSKTVPLSHFKEMMKGSELYTVGALEGMGPLGPNEDECVGIPDAKTLTILPWDSRYAVAAADLTFHGKPYDHDSRWVLHRQIAAAADMGYIMNMGVEPEVYVLQKREGNWIPFVLEDLLNAPTRGYDIETTILADPFLDPMVEHINALPHRQQLGNLLVVQKQGHIYDSPSVLLLVSHRVSSEICVQARTAVQYSTGDFLRIGINSASSFATITDGYAA